MTCTVVDFAKDRTEYNISGSTREELDKRLNLFFASEGYKIKSEKQKGEKVYKKGNFLFRILLGSLAKYHQFLVKVKEEDSFSVLLQRDASGISGGLAGMRQVRKEFAKLTEEFKIYFNN